MGWLEDMLTGLAQHRNALMTASQTGGTMAPDPGENAPQSPGPVADPSSIRGVSTELGSGVNTSGAWLQQQGGPGLGLGRGPLNRQYRRLLVQRGGRTLEGHDYGGGDVKYFQRKNPNALLAAGRVSAMAAAGRPAADIQQQIGALSEPEQLILRRLLGR